MVTLTWLLILSLVAFTRYLFKSVGNALRRSAGENTSPTNIPQQHPPNAQQAPPKATPAPNYKQTAPTPPKGGTGLPTNTPLTPKEPNEQQEQHHQISAEEIKRAVVWNEILKRKF